MTFWAVPASFCSEQGERSHSETGKSGSGGLASSLQLVRWGMSKGGLEGLEAELKFCALCQDWKGLEPMEMLILWGFSISLPVAVPHLDTPMLREFFCHRGCEANICVMSSVIPYPDNQKLHWNATEFLLQRCLPISSSASFKESTECQLLYQRSLK